MNMKLPQPEVNIGMVGHVDHGKSTLTKALTGKKTDVHSEEIKRGISIKLGYADTPIFKCFDSNGAIRYTNTYSENCELSRVISIVDAPGHETLMATMLSGSALMNGALLVVAANERCPQPQTIEHMTAIEIMDIKNIIIIQNKIDLVTRERAIENYREIKNFVKGTIAENAPVIPVSAYHNRNIDKVFEAIEKFIPSSKRDKDSNTLMNIARSFDVNKPGVVPEKINGGVIGGSLVSGSLSTGDEIEISPGLQLTKNSRTVWENVVTEVTSLMAGTSSYDVIYPGGLSAVGTKLDPYLTKNDSLTGRVLGKAGKVLPTVFSIVVESHLLKRTVGSLESKKVEPLKTKETLMLTVGTANTIGMVTNSRDGVVEFQLKYPVAAFEGERIAIGRRINNRWHLIGYGNIKSFQ